MNGHSAQLAHDLLRLDDLDRANYIAETEIQKVADQGNGAELWELRFVRAEVMRLRGKPEQALEYLESQESLNPPDGRDIESQTRLHMHRGYHLGLIARYQEAHRLLAEAEAVSRTAGLIERRAEFCLRQAMILFLQKDYTASDRTYRIVLERSDQLGGWYFRATALWGIGKNLMIQRHYEEAAPWLERCLRVPERDFRLPPFAANWVYVASASETMPKRSICFKGQRRSTGNPAQSTTTKSRWQTLAAFICNVAITLQRCRTTRRRWCWPAKSKILCQSRSGRTTSGSPTPRSSRWWTNSIPERLN